MADRVQSSTGSINARWRRESGGGNTDQPESDTFRGFAETRRTMKSSTMKGASSPCQSATAETKPNREKPKQDG